MTDVTITLRADDAALLLSAVDAELEHINDSIKFMDGRDLDPEGREEVIDERKRQNRLEAIREYILSEYNVAAAAAGVPVTSR